MGLLRSLLMLLPLIFIILSSKIQAQSPGSPKTSARSLDALLQDYAYRAFNRPRTGISYNGTVPSNITGIKISAMRLRSGSLRKKGVKNYNEFEIPVGVIVQPYVERLVVVYQNLGNWSLIYYPLPNYTFLAPVVGLLAYNASNLSATNLPELDLNVSGKPILIKFQGVKSVPVGSTAKCVSFDLRGSSELSNVVSENVCSTVKQGHFSIVIESIAPSPAPLPPPPPPSPTKSEGGGGKDNKKVWKIVGSIIGGLLLLVLLCFLIIWVRKYKQRKKIQQMETAAEDGESLQMRSIRDTRTPTAMGTRTLPALEHEYVP